MRLFDITPMVSPALKVWPGDTPPSREVQDFVESVRYPRGAVGASDLSE